MAHDYKRGRHDDTLCCPRRTIRGGRPRVLAAPPASWSFYSSSAASSAAWLRSCPRDSRHFATQKHCVRDVARQTPSGPLYVDPPERALAQSRALLRRNRARSKRLAVTAWTQLRGDQPPSIAETITPHPLSGPLHPSIAKRHGSEDTRNLRQCPHDVAMIREGGSSTSD